ncbi:MAG: SDR family NAD(P)-dependent oxidoreductase [Thermoanaerobaculia bacterium]
MKDLSLYEKLMRVNFLGAVYPAFYALPHLKKSRGRIAVVSSLAGMTGVPTRTGYAATKHALFGFFNSLRIHAQLIDVESGFHLWANRYDRSLEDVFALQDDISKHPAFQREMWESALGVYAVLLARAGDHRKSEQYIARAIEADRASATFTTASTTSRVRTR